MGTSWSPSGQDLSLTSRVDSSKSVNQSLSQQLLDEGFNKNINVITNILNFKYELLGRNKQKKTQSCPKHR